MNHGVRLAEQLGSLVPVIAFADEKPTPGSVAVFELLSGRIDKQLSALQDVIENELPAFNHKVQDEGLGALVVT